MPYNFESQSDPVDWLRREYLRRRERNPQYSLRAFARQLKLPVGSVSEVFSRKRGLTPKMGARIAESLSLSAGEKERLIALINRSREFRKDAFTDEREPDTHYHELSSDVFAVIADWYHYGILALMETSDFDSDPAWIGSRLRISVTEVRAALERLGRLGLVREGRNGLEVAGYLSSSQDVPSEALRRFHAQLLDRARAALEEVPVEERDISAITMAVDVSLLPDAKRRIRAFRRRMAEFLSSGSCTEVYHLNVQLIPVTRRR